MKVNNSLLETITVKWRIKSGRLPKLSCLTVCWGRSDKPKVCEMWCWVWWRLCMINDLPLWLTDVISEGAQVTVLTVVLRRLSLSSADLRWRERLKTNETRYERNDCGALNGRSVQRTSLRLFYSLTFTPTIINIWLTAANSGFRSGDHRDGECWETLTYVYTCTTSMVQMQPVSTGKPQTCMR